MKNIKKKLMSAAASGVIAVCVISFSGVSAAGSFSGVSTDRSFSDMSGYKKNIDDTPDAVIYIPWLGKWDIDWYVDDFCINITACKVFESRPIPGHRDKPHHSYSIERNNHNLSRSVY